MGQSSTPCMWGYHPQGLAVSPLPPGALSRSQSSAEPGGTECVSVCVCVCVAGRQGLGGLTSPILEFAFPSFSLSILQLHFLGRFRVQLCNWKKTSSSPCRLTRHSDQYCQPLERGEPQNSRSEQQMVLQPVIGKPMGLCKCLAFPGTFHAC